jgi:MFS transporter, AAHS family, benzoate transport protein
MTTDRPHLTPVRTPPAVLLLGFAALVLEGYDIVMYGTVVPSLLTHQDWSMTPDTVGHIGSGTVAGMLVGALVAGLLSDRVGRRRVLMASVTLFSVAMLACAVAGGPGQFAAFRILVGLGTGGLLPTVVALVVDHSPRHRTALNCAIAFAGVGVGGALAGILGTLLVPDHGFRIMFALGGLPILVVLPLMWWLLPEARAFERAHDEGAGWLGATRTLLAPPYLRPTLVFAAAIFFCLLIVFGANAWLPALMIKSGYGVTSSLSFLLVLNLGAAVGTLAASPVADRMGAKLVVVAAFLAAAVSLALLATKPPVALVYVLVAIVGVGTTGTQILLNAYVGAFYPTELRATALGLTLGLGRLGGILGPTYGAHLLTGLGHGWQFHAYAIPAALGAAVVLCVPRRGRAGAGGSGDDVGSVTGHEQPAAPRLDAGAGAGA